MISPTCLQTSSENRLHQKRTKELFTFLRFKYFFKFTLHFMRNNNNRSVHFQCN